MATLKNNTRQVTFKNISQDDLPQGRKGKHHSIVAQLLHDIAALETGRALKIKISELPDSMANIRSALNRAGKKRNLAIETSSDEDHFYVWKTQETRGSLRK
jgi:hypothetical protein